MVILRLFGGVELVGPDGQPVRSILTQRRRLAVLLYLAAASYPRRFHSKDAVRALFWPDADDSHARRSLNRAVYVLRHALGPGVIETHGDDEVGVGAQLRCDVILFHEALERGELEATTALYRGDLADGFFVSRAPEFERWIEAERARLRTRAGDAVAKLIDHAERRGDLESAARWAHRGEVLAPYDERMAARRIGLLDRLGDRAAALLAFEALQVRLLTGLDVRPSPETMAHVAAIRARITARPPVPAPAPTIAPEPVRQAPARSVPENSTVFGSPLLIGVGILGLLGLLSSALLHPRALALTTTRAIPVTSEPGIEFQPALSPDGDLVAFARPVQGRMTLNLRSVGLSARGGEIPLGADSSADQMLPSWTSDGQRVRFINLPHPPLSVGPFDGQGLRPALAWKEVDRQGGTTHELPLPRAARWAAWSADGTQAAFAAGDSLFIYDSASHRARLLADEGGASPNSFAWSPDGLWIAYVEGNPLWLGGFNTAPSQIWLVATADGRRVPVTDAGHMNLSPAWWDARHLLFVSDLDGQREVYMVTLGRSGSPGLPLKVPGGTDAHSISVSMDGRRLAVARSRPAQQVRRFALHSPHPQAPRDGIAVTSGSQVVETHDVSPDGRWLAYDTNLHGNADIYIVRLDSAGGTPIPIVTGPESHYSPRWSPDGREIAYYGGVDGSIWVVPASSGTPTRLGGPGELPAWSPDGLAIVFRSLREGSIQAWIVTRDRIGGPWHPARQLTDFGCAFPVWAPDGSGVICGSLERPTALTAVDRAGVVLWRRDFAALGLGRLRPMAITDGPTVYLGASRDNQAGIWAVPLSGGAPRLLVTFADPLLVVHSYPGTINVTRDRLYLTVGEFESDVWVMDLLPRP